MTSMVLVIDEKELERQAVGTEGKPGVARMLGFKAFHTLRSKGSQPGYPDWTLARERLVFVELKAERGKLSEAQRDWLRALRAAGAEAYVVRSSTLQWLAVVLAARREADRPPRLRESWSSSAGYDAYAALAEALDAELAR